MAMATSNSTSTVLSFRGASASRERVVLTPILAELDERGAVVLRQLLNEVWEHADDRFFAMAEQLPSQEKHHYLSALRTIRLDKEAIFARFFTSIRNSFSILLPAKQNAEPSAVAEVALFNGTECRDTVVAIEAMLLKAEKNYSRELWVMSDGLRRVSGDRFTTSRNLPYSPRVIAAAFVTGLDNLDINADAKLILLKLADRYLFGELRLVYGSIMEGLRKAGVRLSDDTQKPKQPNSASAAGTGKRPLADSRGKDGAFRLAANRMSLQRSAASDQALPRFALIKVLNSLQRRQFEFLSQEPAKALAVNPAALKALIKTELGADARNGCIELSKRDSDIVGLISLQFESALNDPMLNPQAAILLASLQLPVLKAGLLDRQFFDRNGHPARNLLGDVISLCQSWDAKDDVVGQPIYHQLILLVKNILEGFNEDTSLFAVIHDEFLSIAGQSLPKTGAGRRGSLQSEVIAARAVAQLLEDRLSSSSALPASIEKVLRSGWNKFMISVYIEHGNDSERWQRALAVLDGIVSSSHPITTVKQKDRLFIEMPIWLEDLRAGLTRQGFNHQQLESLMSDIEILNLKRLSEAKLVSSADGASAEAHAMFDMVLGNLRVGDWLEYRPNATDTVRCRLAAIINGSGKYIFVDNGGKRVADWQRPDLADLFTSGKLKMLDDNQLFDSALGDMVSDVRKRQDKPLD